MYGKAALALLVAIVLLISCTLFIGTVDLRSQFFPLLQPKPFDPFSACAFRHPLRVYMYDIHRRYHVGMLDRRRSVDEDDNDDAPVTARNMPRWPSVSGLMKQHSVEFWLMASLLYEEQGGGGGHGDPTPREAIRVADPETADAFFVPFFSSLSYNTHDHNTSDPNTEIDHQLQKDIVGLLKQSKYWQRSGGRDHVIPMHHPNAFRFLREQVNASILIVADFGRYPKTLSNLNKDVVAPYFHMVDSFTDDDPGDPFNSRPTLLYFRGRTIRKAGGIVRSKLQKILAGYDDVRFERSHATTESVKASTRGMRSSKFCLHPAGDTPSSCRLFDAIVSHCVPVIVSDRIELPYEDEIDYSQFAIFFSAEEAVRPSYMVEQLRQFPKERWVEMWRRLKNVSNRYEYQYPPRQGDAVDMIWRQVRHKLPAATLAVHRSQRLKVAERKRVPG